MISMAKSTTNNNSIFRRLNPSFKFIIFILSVFLFFIPAGFFGQIILVIFVLCSISLAKLTKKTYINLFKTLIIMTSIFLLLNWITTKTPIAIYYDDSINYFGPFNNVINTINSHDYGYSDNILITPVLGGSSIVSHQELNRHINYFVEHPKDVENWIKGLNSNEFNIALNDMKTIYPHQSEAYNRSMLYVLNNSYVINDIEYNNYYVTNIPSNFYSGYFLLNPDAVVLYTKKWYSIGYMAFFNSINVSLKIMMIICSSTILTSTTTPSELINGIEKLFSPLKIIKFPANQVALILSIGIRFIPSLLVESKRILNAQASRGLDFYNGNLWIKIKALVSLIIPLFTMSINRSYDLANAMDARGFNPRAERTKYRVLHTRYFDYIYLFIVLTIASLLIFLWSYNLLFISFGVIEADLIL